MAKSYLTRKQCEAIASEAFSKYKKEEKIYVTEDGQGFLGTKQNAAIHHSKRQNPNPAITIKIFTFERSETAAVKVSKQVTDTAAVVLANLTKDSENAAKVSQAAKDAYEGAVKALESFTEDGDEKAAAEANVEATKSTAEELAKVAEDAAKAVEVMKAKIGTTTAKKPAAKKRTTAAAKKTTAKKRTTAAAKKTTAPAAGESGETEVK